MDTSFYLGEESSNLHMCLLCTFVMSLQKGSQFLIQPSGVSLDRTALPIVTVESLSCSGSGLCHPGLAYIVLRDEMSHTLVGG